MAIERSSEHGVSTFDDGAHSHCIAKTEDKGGVESKRFYLTRTTALEMLRDRGYQVSDAELSLSLSEFRSGFGEKPDLERLRISVPLRSNPMKKASTFLIMGLLLVWVCLQTQEILRKASTFSILSLRLVWFCLQTQKSLRKGTTFFLFRVFTFGWCLPSRTGKA